MDKIIQALLGKFPERHHGLIARLAAKGQTESEIVAKLMESADEDHNAALAKLTEEVASLKAGLATKDEEIAKLTAQLEDLKPKEEEEVPAGDGDSKTGANLAAPKTIKEGMARLTAGGSTLTGWDLRTAALKQWPALRATVPSMSGRAAAAG